MYFGETIKLFRSSKNLTQVEVALSLDITPEYLSKLENNQKKPSVVLLSKLSKILDIPIQLLLFSSLEKDDIPLSQRANFKKTKPLLTQLIQKILSDDTDFDEVSELLLELKKIRGLARIKKESKKLAS